MTDADFLRNKMGTNPFVDAFIWRMSQPGTSSSASMTLSHAPEATAVNTLFHATFAVHGAMGSAIREKEAIIL